MTAPSVPEGAPSPEEMHHLAQRIAVLGVREDDAKQGYTAARKAAASRFALARSYGITQVAVNLPGGVQAGLLALKQGGTTYDVDEGKLLALVAAGTPSEVENAACPGAQADPRVLDLLAEHAPDLLELRPKAGALADERAVKILAEHAPDLLEARIVPDERERLQEYLEAHEGRVPDPATGEPVQVATVTHHDPTGDFSWTGKTKAMPRVREALESGRLVITANGDVAETVTGVVVTPDAIEGGAAA